MRYGIYLDFAGIRSPDIEIMLLKLKKLVGVFPKNLMGSRDVSSQVKFELESEKLVHSPLLARLLVLFVIWSK